MIRSCLVHAVALVAALTLGSCTSSVDPKDGPAYATSFVAVTLDRAAPTPLKLAVQACAGLKNRRLGGSVYVQSDDNDARWLTELKLAPAQTVSAEAYLETCRAEFPACVRYDHDTQQALLPNILTVASVLGTLPLDTSLAASCTEVAFDAVDAFADKATPELATRHVFERFASQTTGLAMLNPGYEIFPKDPGNPLLDQQMSGVLVDFVFSQRLFVVFLIKGCSSHSSENALLFDIVNAGHWATPLGVYGYNNSWMIGGGFIHEAQTNCLSSRNMGAIPTETRNLSFFSTRRAPITEPGVVVPNAPEDITYDPTRTYVSFVIGDGDNVDYILRTRNAWLRQRLESCKENADTCVPITWSISPHLGRLAPDVLAWYYAQSHETGADYFTLPPSGHLYAYPSSLEIDEQDAFVAATENDASVLGVHSTVHWDFAGTWGAAENSFLPKYAVKGIVRGIIPLNVPYSMEAFPDWPTDRFYKVIDGTTALFRPRSWRGVDDSDEKFMLSPERMSEELGGYPKGTVTAVYMTSDGGLTLENSVLALVPLLPEHVQLVSADTAARLALEASR